MSLENTLRKLRELEQKVIPCCSIAYLEHEIGLIFSKSISEDMANKLKQLAIESEPIIKEVYEEGICQRPHKTRYRLTIHEAYNVEDIGVILAEFLKEEGWRIVVSGETGEKQEEKKEMGCL